MCSRACVYAAGEQGLRICIWTCVCAAGPAYMLYAAGPVRMVQRSRVILRALTKCLFVCVLVLFLTSCFLNVYDILF